MTVPPTYRKPSVVREIEALRVKTNEVLFLRISSEIPVEEVELLSAALEAGPLKGRVVIVVAADGTVEPVVVEAANA